jgi:hypothetical protein
VEKVARETGLEPAASAVTGQQMPLRPILT